LYLSETLANSIAGSAFTEYKKSGTVHGIPLPEGLIESQKLPEPIFTPSTKAEPGSHDENISPEQGKPTYPPVFFFKLTQHSQLRNSLAKTSTTKSHPSLFSYTESPLNTP
jgi:phosphoribosylaminoimidazole-succinocarboxamide synthase